MELSPVFARRLYFTLLVENLEIPNVPKLIERTGYFVVLFKMYSRHYRGSASNSSSFKMVDVITTAITNFRIGDLLTVNGFLSEREISLAVLDFVHKPAIAGFFTSGKRLLAAVGSTKHTEGSSKVLWGDHVNRIGIEQYCIVF